MSKPANKTTPAKTGSVGTGGTDPMAADFTGEGDTPTQAPARKRAKALTTTLFSAAHTPNLAVRVTGPLYEKVMPTFSKREDKAVELLPVVNLDTGEEGDLIINTIMHNVFSEYGDSIVGRSFEIVTGKIREGKDYRDTKIYELEE